MGYSLTKYLLVEILHQHNHFLCKKYALQMKRNGTNPLNYLMCSSLSLGITVLEKESLDFH